MSSRNTYISDLHGHSIYSDGYSKPTKIVDAAVRNGLNVIALTDHNTTLGLLEFDQRLKEVNQDEPKIIGIYGIEVSTQKGHVIFLFHDIDVANEFGRYIKHEKEGNDFNETILLSKNYDCFMIFAHPEVPNIHSVKFEDISDFVKEFGEDFGKFGVEQINAISRLVFPKFQLKKHLDLGKFIENIEHEIKLFGNTDYHSPSGVGLGVTVFETDQEIVSSKDFIHFLKHSNVFGEPKINRRLSLLYHAKVVLDSTIGQTRYQFKQFKSA